MKKRERGPRGRGASPSAQPPEPYSEASIPLFCCGVCMLIILAAFVIDRLVHPFSNGLLAPAILEIVAVLLPAYLVILAVYPGRSPIDQIRAVGPWKLRAKYIFFIIFASAFLICASVPIAIIFGATGKQAEGFVLLGTFVAGKSEYTVALPYLILVYAVIPAIAEEILLRGLVLSQLRGVGFAAGAAVSALLSALLNFSVAGFIPAVFAAIVLCFVMYTTRSLVACIITHFVFNLYRLMLESNVSAYYESSSSRVLLIVVVIGLTLIFGALFFGEAARLYGERAEKVSSGEQEGTKLSLGTTLSDLKRIVAYRPTAIMACICAAIFVAVVTVEYFV